MNFGIYNKGAKNVKTECKKNDSDAGSSGHIDFVDDCYFEGGR